ncbi:MAG: hypothetical protein ABMA64_35050 [Myxococcota bacterium]
MAIDIWSGVEERINVNGHGVAEAHRGAGLQRKRQKRHVVDDQRQISLVAQGHGRAVISNRTSLTWVFVRVGTHRHSDRSAAHGGGRLATG